MADPRRPARPTPPALLDGDEVIAAVLRDTEATIVARTVERDAAKAEWKRRAPGKRPKAAPKDVNVQLSFAISFGSKMGARIADALQPDFPGMIGSEVGSASSEGDKRVDVSYSTPKAGLGLMVSLKSVHRGEADDGRANFIHNLKRNDEELRAEATSLHIRQPYAVLVAVLFLPFMSCDDVTRRKNKLEVSSFGRWVEKLWSLKGREDPDGAPNTFELVFVGLYSPAYCERGLANPADPRLSFYEVGGPVACPRKGEPEVLLTFRQFLERMKTVYDRRNSSDFRYADGEGGRVTAVEEEEDEDDEQD